MFEKLIPYDAAHIILHEYIKYHHQHKKITKRAKIRFEYKDWSGIQKDARARINLYRKIVGKTTEKLKNFLDQKTHDETTWWKIKEMYFDEIVNFNTRNIAETFFNSVFRHTHKDVESNIEVMFINATGTYREFKSTVPIYHTFEIEDAAEKTIQNLFKHYEFDVPYQDLNRDIEFIVKTFKEKFIAHHSLKLEVLKSIFFRNKGAYIVGRINDNNNYSPFVLSILNEDKGIYIDTLLLEYNDISSIFSYNRSYFLVDVDIMSEMVDFLKSIVPTKSLGELYNSIGFNKHGKTVFYRDFIRHLKSSNDQFIIAPGIEGMVMLVFTLPSYNMVFKIIRERFAPPKKVTEREVKEKYEIVSLHDRVGRMTDSHMFENLIFDKRRFSDALLEELIKEVPTKIELTEDTITFKHIYVEKKMIPLNMYLESANIEDRREAINEYGKAIKQLAAVNIFPGDMLLKNFGVTRLKRVVFYDYDEIGFLTDFRFRRIPQPRDEYEEMSAGAWFHVEPNDIFPEEFPRFLIGDPQIKQLFLEMHGDLYDVKFWRDTQARLREGEIITVFPYRKRLKFKNRFEI